MAAALDAADQDTAQAGSDTTDWRATSLTKLTTHIVQTHHAFHEARTPADRGPPGQGQERPRENHPELADLAQVYGALRAELEAHLAKEEQVLFPLIQEVANPAGRHRSLRLGGRPHRCHGA